ncbi:hypothetical protein GN138_03515 [Winogradskyella sp. HL2-2]|uniref:DUF2946 domain-containing protein n=1 Tax=Winogradskyella endarachnes TaxID=2681965 RepID=A0A6L6U5N8_9FLAO|nr:hypothetical protein [Winogradskyella endarachnes]
MHQKISIFASMKFLAFILAITMLALSAMPCSDGQNLEDQQHEEISAEHNHQKDSDDSCPITCICNCCGISITYEPLATFELLNFHKISTQLISTYQSNYRFDFHSNIWQPPQVIS